MKVWITNYCLTKGIIGLDVEFDKDGAGYCKEHSLWLYLGNKDVHTTRSSAVARANEVLRSRIESTEKSLSKLRRMSFE